MATRMQQRRGTATQWTTANPVLNAGEIGFESDTNKFKIGDGTNTWSNLDYFIDEDQLDTTLGDYVETSLLGQVNGVATLNSAGKLESSQLPSVDELSQDAINTALVAGTGLDKTYDDNANTITLDIDSTVTTNTGTQTLTNKSIDLANNTVTGTIALFNTALSDADFVTLTGTETLTNKTLTTPVISSITNTGTLTLPTTTGTVALTSDITTAINNLVDGAPAALDTLNEIAAALNDDSSYANTIVDALALKAPLNSPTFTGTVGLPSGTTLANALVTGTLSAGGAVGSAGQYLESTGSGVQWTTVSGYAAPTLGSTSIASGATVTTISGLTDIELNGPGSIADELALLMMGAL